MSPWKILPGKLTPHRTGSNSLYLTSVYEALKEKGYNPINQIVGYILSGGPHLYHQPQQRPYPVRKVDRDELLQVLVKNYLRSERRYAAKAAPDGAAFPLSKRARPFLTRVSAPTRASEWAFSPFGHTLSAQSIFATYMPPRKMN